MRANLARKRVAFSQPDLAVRFVVGGLLLASALLKGWLPAETAVVQAAYDVPRWAVVALVQVELALAAALMSGIWPRATRIAAMGLFGAFAVFSLYRAASGAEYCGCFGPIRVSPWWTFLLDLGVLALLGLFPLRSVAHARPRLRTAFAVAGYAALGLSLARVGVSRDLRSGLPESGGLTILEPSKWVGEAFPLTSHIQPQVSVANGDWTVVLYHYDCPECRAAKARYEELSRSQNRTHVLLVEVPPYGPETLAGETHPLYARLSDDREWFVQAPVEIGVSDGHVTYASLELASIDIEDNAYKASRNQRELDLGKLELGEKPRHTFSIRNTSGNPFVITSIQKTCGCETTSIRKGMSVANGELLNVPYELPSHGGGRKSGRLLITTDSDDTSFRTIVLTLRAELPRVLWATPPALFFGGPQDTEFAPQVLRLDSDVPGMFSNSLTVSTSRELVNVEVKKRSADFILFNVALRSDPPSGDAYDYIKVRLDDPERSRLNVKVRSRRDRQESPLD